MLPTAARRSRQHRRPTSGRRPARWLVLLVAIATTGLALAACGYDGPTEADFLPAATLVYPGSTDVERTFTREEKIDTIDGANRYDPAAVTIEGRFSSPTSQAELEAWYQQQLSAEGWEPEVGRSVQELRMRRELDGYHHVYAIRHEGDAYRITYAIRDPACDADCFAR